MHGDYVSRVVERDPRVAPWALWHSRPQFLLPAHQDYLYIVMLKGTQGPGYYLPRGMIPTHSIEGDPGYPASHLLAYSLAVLGWNI